MHVRLTKFEGTHALCVGGLSVESAGVFNTPHACWYDVQRGNRGNLRWWNSLSISDSSLSRKLKGP